ncbi:UNVERIFIED_CONTAM: hypothetical protein Slati_2763000 [Sesamum latifolium]|uniref:Retrotransposon gag domain-containing protein n=1 Tax=Sesamum latifolium TaxID=2727402 RepID=A0AAW2VY02_9LAMI
MPRSSRSSNLEFDPEIEKTACRLREETKQLKGEAPTSSESETDLTLNVPTSSDSEEEVMVQNPERTIKKMTSLDLNQQSLCIEYPTLDVDFELKSGLIHLLPTFCGLTGVDPHKHLKEFHVVCSGMRPQGVIEEQVKLRVLPFSLGEKAKDWLYSLPSGSIISWNELKKQFLENYFPASRTITIRKKISGIHQFFGKNFHEYLGRFNHLVESCPRHQIPDHILIQYFYEGLTEANRSLVDATSGGALYDKTPIEACKLITTMAANNQQFDTKNDNPPQKVNEVRASIDERLDELISLVRKFVVGGSQQVKACGICTSPGYFIDACPTLQEEPTMHTNAIGGFSGPSQRGYPFFNTYNPGWRDHPNLRYGNQSQNFQKPPPPQSNPYSVKKSYNSKIALGLDTHSKTEQNIQFCMVGEEHHKVFVPKPPFSERFAKSKTEDEEKEILETLRKVEVNIPLLNAIKQVPRYAKFLKELRANKIKLRGNERVSMGENVSTILQRKLPPKCKDLEMGVVLQLADRSIVYPEGVLEIKIFLVDSTLIKPPPSIAVWEKDASLASFLTLLNERPYGSRVMIDERLLGHFGLSPQVEPLEEPLADIMFNKYFWDYAAGERGGDTPPAHLPRGTPASSGSKGKSPMSPPIGVTSEGPAKRTRARVVPWEDRRFLAPLAREDLERKAALYLLKEVAKVAIPFLEYGFNACKDQFLAQGYPPAGEELSFLNVKTAFLQAPNPFANPPTLVEEDPPQESEEDLDSLLGEVEA